MLCSQGRSGSGSAAHSTERDGDAVPQSYWSVPLVIREPVLKDLLCPSVSPETNTSFPAASSASLPALSYASVVFSRRELLLFLFSVENLRHSTVPLYHCTTDL